MDRDIQAVIEGKSDGCIVAGDCLDVMRTMPDGCVDLVLTDPPYGEAIARKSNTYGIRPDLSRKATGEAWDDRPATEENIRALMKVSRNQIVFGTNYFWEAFYSTRCYVVWDKRGDMPDVPFADTEFAWTSFVKRPSRRYVLLNHGFVSDVTDVRTGHPTQKPEQLMIWLLRDFSESNTIILDPFCGSGTTCVAAKMLGRRYIGIEISEEYCEIARRRLDAVETAVPVAEAKAGQMALFGGDDGSA